jgi:ABC-type spermidine/putrescine transport system permease subunit II
VWGTVVFFFINLAGVIGSVVVSSFGTRWFDTWLPQGFTTRWYGAVPSVPFVILTMTPFIGQIDPAIERAARMCGARTWQVFPAHPRSPAGAGGSWPPRFSFWSGRSVCSS